MPLYSTTRDFPEIGNSFTDTRDLLELAVPSDRVVILHSLEISWSGINPDDSDGVYVYSLVRVTGSPTSGSGGTSITAQPTSEGSPAHGSTIEVSNDTKLTGGTETTLYVGGMNISDGMLYMPPPACRPVFSPSTYCVFRNLGDSVTGNLTGTAILVFEEIGT